MGEKGLPGYTPGKLFLIIFYTAYSRAVAHQRNREQKVDAFSAPKALLDQAVAEALRLLEVP